MIRGSLYESTSYPVLDLLVGVESNPAADTLLAQIETAAAVDVKLRLDYNATLPKLNLAGVIDLIAMGDESRLKKYAQLKLLHDAVSTPEDLASKNDSVVTELELAVSGLQQRKGESRRVRLLHKRAAKTLDYYQKHMRRRPFSTPNLLTLLDRDSEMFLGAVNFIGELSLVERKITKSFSP